jgi:hypothetical protein
MSSSDTGRNKFWLGRFDNLFVTTCFAFKGECENPSTGYTRLFLFRRGDWANFLRLKGLQTHIVVIESNKEFITGPSSSCWSVFVSISSNSLSVKTTKRRSRFHRSVDKVCRSSITRWADCRRNDCTAYSLEWTYAMLTRRGRKAPWIETMLILGPTCVCIVLRNFRDCLQSKFWSPKSNIT